jgi:PilZ domain
MNGRKKSRETNNLGQDRRVYGLETICGYPCRMTTGNDTQAAIAAKSRTSARESIFLSAVIQYEGAKHPVTARIRNISSTGMMIDCAQLFHPGHRLVAEIKNIGEVEGQVAWATDNRMGISFDNEIDPKQARFKVGTETRATNIGPAYPRSTRPGLLPR